MSKADLIVVSEQFFAALRGQPFSCSMVLQSMICMICIQLLYMFFSSLFVNK